MCSNTHTHTHTHTHMSESITRTGQYIFRPLESDIYSVNPCPPVRFFSGLTCDYYDCDGNYYYQASSHERLSSWVNESVLSELIASNYDAKRDCVCFVRQNPKGEQKKENQVFTLPCGSGENIVLVSNHKPDKGEWWNGTIVEIGERGAGVSYCARGVVWVLMRDFTCQTSPRS